VSREYGILDYIEMVAAWKMRYYLVNKYYLLNGLNNENRWLFVLFCHSTINGTFSRCIYTFKQQ
jgi:hypothetical protein